MVFGRVSVVVLGLWLGLAQVAPTNPAGPPATRSPSAGPCARETTALGGMACALAAALGEQAQGALVVAVSAPGQARLPEPMRQNAADLLAARLGASASSLHDGLALSDALKRARLRRLVYVTLTLSRDHLEATADAYEARGRFWQRLREPAARVVAHAFESRPLDPELRALFPPIPLVVTRVDKAKLADRDAVALACGDLAGDGSSELVLVTRHRVASGRIEHGQFSALAQAAWSELSKVAPSPPREPIASAWLVAPGRVRVGLSDRADGLELSAKLSVAARFHGLLPWPGGGCAARGALALQGQLASCGAAAGEPTEPADFAADVDTVAGERVLALGGGSTPLHAARPVGGNVVKIWYRARWLELGDAGAKLVVGDLDGDGNPEIITTSPSLERKDDALVVRTLDASGALRQRLRLPVAGGIDAIAACPGDGNTMAPLALATGDALWIVR